MTDAINPQHYRKGAVECIDAIRSALTAEQYIGYLRGNLIKYSWRYQDKGGVTDLRKANWYLSRLIEATGE